MNFEKTSNPVFSNSRLENFSLNYAGVGNMTIQGVANKTLLLLALVMLSAIISWKLFMVGNAAIVPCMIGGGIGALILSIMTCAKQEWAHITGPIYALCEGLLLGAISAMFESQYHGIVTSAIFLTFAVSIVVFLCYRMGILRASNTFVKVITYATIGIGVFYLISWISSMFGVHFSLADLGFLGLIIQIVIVAVAALNLVLDFKMVEEGVEQGAPAQFEWYCAFGLMVTLVWIYIEILRLIALILGRRD